MAAARLGSDRAGGAEAEAEKITQARTMTQPFRQRAEWALAAVSIVHGHMDGPFITGPPA